MPSDSLRVLVDKNYLIRIEKENELYRYHLRDFEEGVVTRLQNGLMDAVRSQQGKTPQKHKGSNNGNARDMDRGAQDMVLSAPDPLVSNHKGIYMLILKLKPKLSEPLLPRKILILRLQPKVLKELTQECSAQTQQLYNANRKRGAEEGSAQATLAPAGVKARTKKTLDDAGKEDLHLDKKMRLEEGPDM